ncbi:phosphotransferase family enzyme [Mobilisporobacter senegalensis]|uniref:Phosphotransferase family enzyme n=1 Tax=Mobilisporobacter senegalensis TaxID=1329262 RepID=A0A3N1XMN3_9FIRM|nr:phosphotransferase [Mobilisporobacter senegalensis]ROR27391.1 phosphotransferase family enzyme [Mobilisporobacter senegalensis]
MTREERCAKIEEAIKALDFKGNYIKHERYGNGHINDTFLIQFNQDDRNVKYILQRMNHEIFKDPDQLMKNICGITEFLKKKITKSHGDVNRETMNVIDTKKGEPFYKDSIGSYWRAYQFIEDAISYDQVDKPEDFYQSAVAFGRFQHLLSDYKAESLYETIPNFHNTPTRYQTFKEAVKKDICGRAKNVTPEIEFICNREDDMKICMDLLNKEQLPLRVTHNDTKLNNIMIDNKTGKGICVIDLDTVMPGLSIFDFGDSIRFGANTAAEDETDLSKVSLNLQLFELYAKGYLEGCNGSLTKKETEMLPMGAKTMALECGMRFLTDYLLGDTYFRIHRENHNLDRCRTQLKLVEDMEYKWDEMNSVIKKYM